jgi:hypothetical protein
LPFFFQNQLFYSLIETETWAHNIIH